jgi:hypothetical protein
LQLLKQRVERDSSKEAEFASFDLLLTQLPDLAEYRCAESEIWSITGKLQSVVCIARLHVRLVDNLLSFSLVPSRTNVTLTPNAATQNSAPGTHRTFSLKSRLDLTFIVVCSLICKH